MRFSSTILSLASIGALAALFSNQAEAQCPPDAFEPNDTCTAAAPLSVANHANLRASELDPDHYVITVPPLEQLRVTLWPTNQMAQPFELSLQDDACSMGLADSEFFEDLATGSSWLSLNWGNASLTPKNVRLRVGSILPNDSCIGYRLNMETFSDPCMDPLLVDGFEENDSCSLAVPIVEGYYPGLWISRWDEDHFRITVPPLVRLNIGMAPEDNDAISYHVVVRDDSCATILAGSDPDSGDSNLSCNWTNASNSPVDVRVQVSASIANPSCTEYNLNLQLIPDQTVSDCLNPALDDGFEHNDTCATATAISAGSYPDLRVGMQDEDHYSIVVPPGGSLLAVVDFGDGTLTDTLSVALFDALTCGTLLDAGELIFFEQEVFWTNTSATPVETVLSVRLVGGTFECRHYDMDISVPSWVCAGGQSDDGYEDNDDCASAIRLTDGVETDLLVQSGDDDFFEFEVAAGQTLTLDLLVPYSGADLEAYLYADDPACGDTLSFLQYVDASTGGGTLAWTNTTGADQTYFAQVRLVSPGIQGCNAYDLRTTGALDPDVTTPFCFGDGSADAGFGPVDCPCGNNAGPGSGGGCLHSESIGLGAVLTVTGSTSVATDDLAFTVTGATSNQMGMLIQGHHAMAAPFKDGVYCMGNETRRIEVLNLDGAGSAATSSSIVTRGAVAVGRTRHYQAWFRDPGGACGTGSNFTQGITVLWR